MTTTTATAYYFTAQAMKRHNGRGTRSVFDCGMTDQGGPFETVAEAMAAGLVAEREMKHGSGYESGWIMVMNDDNEVVAEAKEGDVELALTRAWPLTWDTIEPLPPLAPLPNPVVTSTALRAYRGWTVREYADGMYDATNGSALSPGYDTFREAVAFARSGGTVA